MGAPSLERETEAKPGRDRACLPAGFSLVVFGGGWLGGAAAREALKRGGRALVTSRDPERRRELAAGGVTALDPADDALDAAIGEADALLVTAPPDVDGCPAVRRLAHGLTQNAAPKWIGYISSTAVYGDRAGGWVFEDEPLNAASLAGARRVLAERQWTDIAAETGAVVQVFRLPTLYGPGRSPVDRLRDGTARLVRKPGQIFNRIHLDDVLSGVFAGMAHPAADVFNLTDDEPTAADVVLEWAAARQGLPLPPETALDDPSASDAMRRFYLDCKRVSNARAKAVLGWRPAYPSWREGLEAIIANRLRID